MSFTIQSQFDLVHPIGFPGMIADMTPIQVMSSVFVNIQVVSIAVTAVNSAVYTVTINGTTYSYTADGSATTGEITVGLAAAINAGTVPVTASGTDTPLILTSDTAQVFTYSVGSNLVATQTTDGDAVIPIGRFVRMNVDALTSDQAVRLPTASGDVTGFAGKGVVLADNYAKIARTDASGNPSHRARTMIPVMRKGHVYVIVEEAVTEGQQAFVRYAAGGLGLGSFRASTGTSEAAALPAAVYIRSASANGLAVLELNLP